MKAYCASLKSSLRAPNSAEKEAVLRQCGIAPIPHPRASWLTRAPLSTEAVQVVKEVVPVPGAVRPPPPAYPPPPSVLTAVAVVPAPAPAPTPTVNQPLALAVALAEVSAWDKLQALLALLCAPEEVPADVTVSEAPPAPTSITPEDILLYHPALTKAVLGMLRRASAEVYGTLKPSKAVLKGERIACVVALCVTFGAFTDLVAYALTSFAIRGALTNIMCFMRKRSWQIECPQGR